MSLGRITGLFAASMVVAACGAPPAACEALCTQSTTLYESCLEDWGLSWEDAGYAGAEGYRNSCDTWVFEQGLLQRDAGEGELDATCAQMQDALVDCNAWFEVWASGEG